MLYSFPILVLCEQVPLTPGYGVMGWKAGLHLRLLQGDRQGPSTVQPSTVRSEAACANQAEQTGDPAEPEQPDRRLPVEEVQETHDQVKAKLRASGTGQDAP